MSDGMEEIIDDFITEAEESLEKIDPLFVELEEKGYDPDLLNGIFRSIHTIKGAAGFLGFQDIVDVSHKTENLLKKLRDGDMRITSALITVILKSIDMLKMLLVVIKDKSPRPEGILALLGELDGALESAQTAVTDDAPAPSAQEEADMAAAAVEPDASDASRYTEDAWEAEMAVEEPVSEAAEPGEEAFEQEPAAAYEPAEETHEQIEEKAEEEAEEDVAQAVSDAIDSVLSVGEEPAQTVKETAYQAQEAAASPARPPEAPRQEPGAAQAHKAVMQTLRVDVDRIDKVMDLTGEIVLVRNRLLNISGALDEKYSTDEHVEGLQESVSFLDLVTADLQLAVMKMRMQPIKKVFGKFPRLVRDISQNLGKDVHLSISGEDTEVDRTVIERIGDPLVHIIRNAIDHGIESIDQRQNKGKPAKGLVEISAFQQGSQIVIEVSDDGRGMDVERIRSRAASQGFVTEDDLLRMTDKEAINLIFAPGFTTMDVASELSGRGVGMDVVKNNISKLNGYVEILTSKDAGTTVRISIPLTLAIIQALMVKAGGVKYAIPLGPIEETIKVARDEIENVAGQPVLKIRDRVFPTAELTDVLNSAPKEEESLYRYMLVISVGDRNFCIAVDELLGQEEVVIKAIDGIDTEATGILGATITGEGKIVLILDPSGMAKMVSSLAGV